MAIPGKATNVGTHSYVSHFPELTYVPFGQTGVFVSQAGFGSYRIDKDNGIHEQALRFALQMGINLVDTSANYTDGSSERLIGRVITDLIENDELQRDELVIISKAGYLQGFNYALAEQYKLEGRPFPNLVKYAEGLDHCIHPDFLADQLTRSLERLNLEAIDGYLLHNPEYYLMWAKQAHYVREDAHFEYYRRIRQAFVHLEQEVSNGRIQWYGISSNAFPEPAGHFTFTSLAEIWQIAEEIGSDHHFRIIQLPMNLFETCAATEKNQPANQSVLQFAQQHALAVMINRPLNAIQNDVVNRLAHTYMPNYPASAEDVSTEVDGLVQLEQQFREQLWPNLALDEENKAILRDYLAIGMMLDGRWRGFGSYQNWLDIRTRYLLRRAQTAVEFLSNLENLPVNVQEWLDEYIESANITFAAITAYYQEKAAQFSRHIQHAAQTADSDWTANTLSQTAVHALRSTKGITSVLVGMRRQEYVQDVLADLEKPVDSLNREESWRKMKQFMVS